MINVQQLNQLNTGCLPGLIGLDILSATPDQLISELVIRDELLAPNGYLHAATVIALADTTCGYGTRLHLESGQGFTTLELKSNFLGTAREGVIRCIATPRHLGRSSQVWEAEVEDIQGKTLALFRCTQMILNVSKKVEADD
ncbi:MAG: PaaI family thioesterase [Amphritea sp.]|nr:PaaI family thioesterase [Amphritea sp.]